MGQLHRRTPHPGRNGSHFHPAVSHRPLGILKLLKTLNARLLLRGTRPRPSLHPGQLIPKNGLPLSLPRSLHLFPLRLHGQIALIIRLIGVDIAFIDFNDPVCHTVQEIPIMGNHYQCALPFLQIILQPVRHAVIQMVGRLVQYKYVGRHQKGSYQRQPLFLPAGQFPAFLAKIRHSQPGEHTLCLAFQLPFPVSLLFIRPTADRQAFFIPLQHALQNGVFRLENRLLGQETHHHMVGPCHTSFIRLLHPRRNLQQRGLSGTVDSDNPYLLPFLQVKRGVVKQLPFSIGFRYVFHCEYVHKGKCPFLKNF